MNLPEFRTLPGAIAIDLDGTLLNSEKMISPRNRRALAGCIERGIPVIIATGRPLRTVRRFLGPDLTAACSLVLSNGAVTIAAPPFTQNARSVFPEPLIRAVIDTVMAAGPDIIITVEIDGLEFGSHPLDRDPVSLDRRNAATPDMVLTLDQAVRRGPSKIAIGGLVEGPERLAEDLERRFDGELSIVISDKSSFLNITLREATKPKAIERLIDSQELTLADVLAIGDDIPDLDMLQACGTAVAMGNAFDEVVAVCPYRTLSNDEDGVAVVLEKLLQSVTLT